MSEPIKKPRKTPESFNPKKPEIANMMNEAGNNIAQKTIVEIGSKDEQMSNFIDFNIKFCGFYETDFINCFAATYMYLEGKQGENDPYYYLLDTMCGHSSIRFPYDGGYFGQTEIQKLIGHTKKDENGNDYTVDFLFGFSGYGYRKLTDPDSFKAAVIASINAGKPVIAKIKPGTFRYRVITGYNRDDLLEPNYKDSNMRNSGEHTSYDVIKILYVISEKIQPRYTLKDGLKRIREVMEFNIKDKPWDGYIEKLGPIPSEHKADAVLDVTKEERQSRMKRLFHTMWPSMNSHSFAMAFRQSELHHPALNELWKQIIDIYEETQDLYWCLIFLYERADWDHPAFDRWQIGTMVKLTLEKAQKNDEMVLDIIKQAIAILEKKESENVG